MRLGYGASGPALVAQLDGLFHRSRDKSIGPEGPPTTAACSCGRAFRPDAVRSGRRPVATRPIRRHRD
ncbi:DUF6053 domain-containing protein [Lysobacter enzymogenes]|uniref:DUF6053 domain-containing protein n=1 Tax=Lysobacter enzymogenes TaxID=69 RepID=UPI003D1887E7